MNQEELQDKDILEYIKMKCFIANGDLGEEALLAQAFLDDVRNELDWN